MDPKQISASIKKLQKIDQRNSQFNQMISSKPPEIVQKTTKNSMFALEVDVHI